MMRTGGSSLQAVGTVTSDVMTTSVAEKTGNTFSAGNNRACSDRESRENGCSDGTPSTEGRSQLLCHGGE